MLIDIRDITKVYEMGEEKVHALSGVIARRRAGRVRRDHGALRLGQVDAHEPDRLPRHAHLRAPTS